MRAHLLQRVSAARGRSDNGWFDDKRVPHQTSWVSPQLFSFENVDNMDITAGARGREVERRGYALVLLAEDGCFVNTEAVSFLSEELRGSDTAVLTDRVEMN
jgi:hypothetical protein